MVTVTQWNVKACNGTLQQLGRQVGKRQPARQMPYIDDSQRHNINEKIKSQEAEQNMTPLF